jgi:hypothetical protein
LTLSFLIVTELYYLIFDKVLHQPDNVDHGSSGYYFAVNGEYEMKRLSEKIATALSAAGMGSSELEFLTMEEAIATFGVSPPLLQYQISNSP